MNHRFWDLWWQRPYFKSWDKPYLQYLFQNYFSCISSLKILDVGCGAVDNFKSHFNNSGSRIVNLDISHLALLELNRKIITGEIRINSKSDLIQSTVLSLPFKDNSFDLVICCQCLHYFIGEERQKSLAEI